MNERLLHILQHSLGVDRYGRGKRYRNHYVAGFDALEDCRELVRLGYMVERPASELTGGDPVFFVTDAGRRAVANHSPEPPNLTRSQKRYLKWLESDRGLSFGEWLKMQRLDDTGPTIDPIDLALATILTGVSMLRELCPECVPVILWTLTKIEESRQ